MAKIKVVKVDQNKKLFTNYLKWLQAKKKKMTAKAAGHKQ